LTYAGGLSARFDQKKEREINMESWSAVTAERPVSAGEKRTNHSKLFSEIINLIESLSIDCQLSLNEILHYKLKSYSTAAGVNESEELHTLIENGLLVAVKNPEAQLRRFINVSDLNSRISPLKIPGFKKNMSYENFIRWCLETIPDRIPEIFSDIVVVKIAPEYKNSFRKISNYLRRKFDFEFFTDGEIDDDGKFIYYSEPWGSVETYHGYKFPDDDITELLDKYEANRCGY